MQFDAAGNRTAPAGPVTFDPVYPAGASAPLNLTLDLGATDQAAGPFTQRTLNQDGFAAGTLSDVTINDEGLVPATFSNGETSAVCHPAMANFTHPEGLTHLSDPRSSVPGQLGDPKPGGAGGASPGR